MNLWSSKERVIACPIFDILVFKFNLWAFHFHGSGIFLNTISWFAFGNTLIFVEGIEL